MDKTLDAARTLDEWRAAEAAVRSRLQPPGVIRPEQAGARTGLALFAAIFAGELPCPPIGETLDFVPMEVGHGRALFQGRPGLHHYNPLGTVHGGWFATLLDSAVGCAIHTTLPAGRLYTTVELKINLVKALTDRVPLVRAEGRTIHVGRSLGTAEGRLYGPDGTLYAHASTTCFIFDRPVAAVAAASG